jgi:plasmid stabilization system protein ParE
MRIRFAPEAAEELAEATAYLAARSPRAAERFLADIEGRKRWRSRSGRGQR